MAVHPIVRALLRQPSVGFEDVRGSEFAATVPVSERLLNELIQATLPASSPVRDVHVVPEPGDRLIVRARLGASALIPPLKVAACIERQPELPSSPELVLRLEFGALRVFAAPAARFLRALPPGIKFDGERLYLDVVRLAAERGFAEYARLMHHLELHTDAGSVILSIRGGVPRSS